MDYGFRFDFPQSAEDVDPIEMKDYGPEPFVVNITEGTKRNDNYRTALWTGSHLQLTLMSLNRKSQIKFNLVELENQGP